jgi:hypothetical protein
VLSEDFSLSFQKVTVEYVPQGKTGGGRGTTTFQTEINSCFSHCAVRHTPGAPAPKDPA